MRRLKNHWDYDVLGMDSPDWPLALLDENLAATRQNNVSQQIDMCSTEWSTRYWNRVLEALIVKYGNRVNVTIN